VSDAKPYTMEEWLKLRADPRPDRTAATVVALDAANARVAELEDAVTALQCGKYGTAALSEERDEWKARGERAEARVAELEAALADATAIAREFDRRHEETKAHWVSPETAKTVRDAIEHALLNVRALTGGDERRLCDALAKLEGR
jgi:predicted  nucleic acid-binding Zn-ribbon protein